MDFLNKSFVLIGQSLHQVFFFFQQELAFNTEPTNGKI